MAHLAPGERYLLLAERDSTANAVLSAYLGWYGLTDRVTLRSPGVCDTCHGVWNAWQRQKRAKQDVKRRWRIERTWEKLKPLWSTP